MSDPNENRPGYKKTKVGWIPEEWDSSQLSDAAVENGIKTGPFGSQLHQEDYVQCGIPVIMPLNMRGGKVVDEKLARVSQKKADALGSQKCMEGDILFARRGEIGRCALITQNEEGWLNGTGSLRLRCEKSQALPDYIVRAVGVPREIHWLNSNAVGQTMLNLNAEIVGSLPLPLPPLPEQQKIAEILSTCDEAIEKTGDLIDAKKRQKKALMQQLLTGKKRLPGFGGSGGRTEHRFFDLPSDWACPHVREVAQEHSERCGDSDSHTVLACSKHLGFVESKTYFKKQVFSEDTSNYKVVRRGWFGFPSNHVEEGSIGLLSTHDSGIVSPIYCVFETSPKIAPDYLYAVFKSETFRHIFSVTTNASVDRRGSLRWDAFGAIRVPCPTLNEQIAIADVNKAATDEITVLESKLAALKQQKKALMQKLLTGQVRVKV